MRMPWTPAAVVLSAALSLGQAPHFEIRSEFGDESAWVAEWLERAHGQLVRMLDNGKVEPPAGIRVELRRDPALRGVGGAATERTLSFTSDRWPRDQWRLWILAHELTNLFTHHYAGAGGYPSDWWADGRSPFPVYAAAQVAEKLGEKETARWLKTVDQEKPDQRLIWKLHERFGFKVFARAIKLLREDGIDLGRIGAGWPAADERRSAWTIAYLSIAAGTNLAPLFREHGIGTEPPDWRARHPERPFTVYAVSDREVADLIELRVHLFGGKAEGRAAGILQDLFRRGATWSPEAGSPAESPPAVPGGPIAFDVRSEFGADSEWTGPYLSKAGAELAALFNDQALELPARVPVRLRKDAGLQGIGGGAKGDAIELVSDQWPEERFRQWILCSELTVLFQHHAGGVLPADWFGHGTKPFATYAAILTLRKLGHADVAEWIRGLSRKSDDELLWALHEEHGFALFARAFALMRRNGADFTKLGAGDEHPQKVRTHHLLAYLSAAAGKSLAPVFRAHRIGQPPPDAPRDFRPYEIPDAEVERLRRQIAK